METQRILLNTNHVFYRFKHGFYGAYIEYRIAREGFKLSIEAYPMFHPYYAKIIEHHTFQLLNDIFLTNHSHIAKKDGLEYNNVSPIMTKY